MAKKKKREITTEQFADFICAKAAEVGKQFTKPDDDWLTTMFLDGTEGMTIGAVEIPEDREVKHFLFTEAMPLVMKRSAPGELRRAAFLSSAWALMDPEALSEYQKSDMESMREHPEVTEVLTLAVADKEGTMLLYNALIFRDDEQPPALQEWEKTKYESGKGEYTGDIPTMLRRAFE